jgi:MinD superfamily P-loop ATPase
MISGDGGTGKTTLTASFSLLADRPVVADCNVKAPDLHSVLQARVKERYEFRSGHQAVIRNEDCICCGVCLRYCRFDAIKVNRTSAGSETFFIDPAACDGCGLCVPICPVEAIDFPERTCGE